MKVVKIGLVVVLLLGIIFFIIKDHNTKDNTPTNTTTNTPIKNTNKNTKIANNNVNIHNNVVDQYQWSTYSPVLPLNDHYSDNQPDNQRDHHHDRNNNAIEQMTNTSSKNSGCSSCGEIGSKLLPVMDPLYNMREICKQSILLEDHLFQKKKRCRDCCMKHQLTIEALAEEAITLDKDGKCRDLYDLPDKIRSLQKDFISNRDPNEIAQEYRKVRKSLMQRCFNNF